VRRRLCLPIACGSSISAAFEAEPPSQCVPRQSLGTRILFVGLCLWFSGGGVALLAADDLDAQTPAAMDTTRGDKMIAAYFREETARLAGACLRDIKTLEDWNSRKEEYRRQLREMLGLDPWPERTPLSPVVTGKVDHELFTVEKLQFQSRPGLYVTGNLFVPRNVEKPLPAILYVCGHSQIKEGQISFGNKTAYQHHGAWFARNGYVCLTIDTLQLGEIEGLHHGTYNLNQWWWNARGYTSAGVETWNGIRALDYLESRPEVDRERLGMTGRSGGGAYTWWVAALDDRVKVAVPVAGITDLENHVVDGTVEGHCDCMYMVNTYRWDFAEVAALVAPRPLLISNTDKDTIFPLEGVVRIHEKVRRIYRLYGAEKQLGLQITEGPHADTQELHIHAFRWFNRFLKDDASSQVEMAAVKIFEPRQLRVFSELPADERNSKIQEEFTVTAPVPAVPHSALEWSSRRDVLLAELREKVFRGWPAENGPESSLESKEAFRVERDGIRLAAYDFTSQHHIRLRLYVACRAGLNYEDLDLVVLNALDQNGWVKFVASLLPAFAHEFEGEQIPGADRREFEQTQKMFQSFKWGMAYVAPRGIGPTAWDQSEKKQTQHRRRFQLLGQTLDGMRAWDVRRAAQTLRVVQEKEKVPLWMQGEAPNMAGIVLYASLFEPNVARLDLWNLPPSHREGPDFLNVLRVLDLPEAVALAAERSKVRLYEKDPAGWEYPQEVAQQMEWDKNRFQLRQIKQSEGGGP
jgi:dienelactone hydrolase